MPSPAHVTAILPRGRNAEQGVFAGYFNMNGNGEMTGTQWIEHYGTIWGPILLPNTAPERLR